MKRFATLLVVSLALAVFGQPADAQKAQKTGKQWVWEPLRIVSTSVSGALDATWPVAPVARTSGVDYVDSTVVRKDGWTPAVFDTSGAIPLASLLYPPAFDGRIGIVGSHHLRLKKTTANAGGSTSDSLVSFLPDTLDNSTWIALRTKQDTLSLGWSSGATLQDTLVVMAEWSNDLVTWHGVTGAPTRAYIADHVVGGADDVDYDAMIETEMIAGADVIEMSTFQCQPSIYTDGTALILNRTLCMAPGTYVRFIVRNSTAAYGQVVYELGRWKE